VTVPLRWYSTSRVRQPRSHSSRTCCFRTPGRAWRPPCVRRTPTPRSARRLHNSRSPSAATTLSEDDAIGRLLALSDADVKAPALKTLQGIAWREGYADGSLVAPLYPDVAPALRAWHAQGHGLYIYSSGSVEAQRLLLGTRSTVICGRYSPDGSTRPSAPRLRRPHSWRSQRRSHVRQPRFFSYPTTTAEVSAARQAGWRAVLIDRRVPPLEGAITTFRDIEI
jgi:enolase-phosphatase E1